MSDAYRKAGVDIEAGDELVRRIKPAVAETHRPEVLGSIGGFAGLFRIDPSRYTDPVLVSGTDGVGTKLLVAHKVGRHDTIGQDLVAMCVNDVITTGAEPLFFLDYFATGKLDVDQAAQVIEGIARACRDAGCALLGGETAEMPALYAPGHYDLAGFCVGIVERDAILDGSGIRPGAALIGVPSSGLHSNGYSLVRKLLVDSGNFSLDEDVGGFGRSLGDELLEPTRIYVDTLRHLRAHTSLLGAAHITGGGIPGNVVRMLPEGCGARLQRGTWPVPPIFGLLSEVGELSEDQMVSTFNCGLGIVCAVEADAAPTIVEAGLGYLVGEVVPGEGVDWT
ncbi:MAG: phosphoribosylformylglycinamidine cyclo-ligase [Myxococcota bacterium]